MNPPIDRISAGIEKLKTIVDDLKRSGADIPALDRNLVRITANIKMLELNFMDIDIEDS